MVEAGSDPSGRTRYRLLETLRALPLETLMPQDAPELYTFGLLSKLDVGDIAALTAPRPVHVTSGWPASWAQRSP